jgi:hypothetical protein
VAVAQYDPLGHAEHPAVKAAARKWGLGEHGIERLTARFTCATDGHTKLVVRNGEELVFDIDSDPGELAAVGDADPTVLREALRHPAACAEPVSAPANGGAGASLPGPDEIAEIEQQMKLLGYL